MSGKYAKCLVLVLSDPEPAALELSEHLGFEIRSSGADGIEVDNGALCLRLERGDRESSFEIVVECEDLDQTVTDLERREIIASAHPEERPRPSLRRRRLSTRSGLRLQLVQELTEDDLDVLPALPKKAHWLPESELLVQRCLKRVPLPFRGRARARLTRSAELVAEEKGLAEVAIEQAVEGLLRATPDFQIQGLHRFLEEQGLARLDS